MEIVQNTGLGVLPGPVMVCKAEIDENQGFLSKETRRRLKIGKSEAM